MKPISAHSTGIISTLVIYIIFFAAVSCIVDTGVYYEETADETFIKEKATPEQGVEYIRTTELFSLHMNVQ